MTRTATLKPTAMDGCDPPVYVEDNTVCNYLFVIESKEDFQRLLRAVKLLAQKHYHDADQTEYCAILDLIVELQLSKRA